MEVFHYQASPWDATAAVLHKYLSDGFVFSPSQWGQEFRAVCHDGSSEQKRAGATQHAEESHSFCYVLLFFMDCWLQQSELSMKCPQIHIKTQAGKWMHPTAAGSPEVIHPI